MSELSSFVRPVMFAIAMESQTLYPKPLSQTSQHLLRVRYHIGLWSIWCASCLLSNAAIAGTPTPPKPPSAALAKVAWEGIHFLYKANFDLATELLTKQAQAPFNVADNQLRIQSNASSIGRLTKAYAFYLGPLSKRFPKQKSVWEGLSKWNALLRSVAHQMRDEALNGEKTKALQQKLKQLVAGFTPHKSNATVPKEALLPKHFGYLLETISGMGTGLEFLGYHRLIDIQTQLQAKKKIAKKDLAPLGALLGQLGQARQMYAFLRKELPKAKWLSLFAYHAALLSRAGLLYGKSLRTKGANQKMLSAKHKRYLTQLHQSLLKANPSFPKFWRR